MNTGRISLLVATAIVVVATAANSPAHAADPLPSWNDGPTKQAMVAFVEKVTKEGSPGFVPVAERIATFDNDGTLWCEHPVVQLVFAIDQLKVLVDKQPQLREKPAVAAALTGNMAYFEKEGEHAIAEIVFLTHAGMTVDKFHELAVKFFNTAKHPKYGVLLKEATYLPMRELLAYLQANGFKTYICSGGGIEFMRAVSEEIYGIPPEQVIGSAGVLEFQDKDAKAVLLKTPKLLTYNDKQDKPAGIELHIGRVPIFAAGNVRTGGDIAMLRYSQSSKHPSLQLLVDHDDGDREFAYAEKDGASLKAAKEHGWTVVNIKDDWKEIFSVKR
ncbi:HAD family hydrolase [Anatilimnocola floriformis]|uniref:HAD family hydrolase n=1 Tax=Anatilimnocola floriformis TaxID=2948575 RepID=UPI0020C452DF|nr:HAD family hydrolase [Anatilimnocola floriformis]